jgi:hypothetical protein
MLLNGLDAVDWALLTHAYGPATTTASELEALTSENPDERSSAFDALVSSICHQGSVYPATAAAVPFLVDVAEIESLPADSRMWVVAMLGWIAEGNVNLRRRHPDSVDEPWVRDLESNLRQVAPRVLDLARGALGAEARAWAVWFIRALPPTSRDLDELRGCLVAEQDALVRATIALGLPRDDAIQTELLDLKEDPLVRLCAAARLIPIAADVDSLVAIAEACVRGSGRFSALPDRSEDTSPIRLIASNLGTVSADRQVAWITRWFPEEAFCVDALYAASDAGNARRSLARLLVGPVKAVLMQPPSTELRSTAAFALGELGLPGVEELRAVASSGDGELQRTARQYLVSHESQIESSHYDPRESPTSEMRSPSELATTLAKGEALDASNLRVTGALNELAAWGGRASEQAHVVASVVGRANSAALKAHAEWVLAQITGDRARFVSALVQLFEPQWGAFVVVKMLGELGPHAAAALPTLREYVARDLRPPDLASVQDDLLAKACAGAIARIESARWET